MEKLQLELSQDAIRKRAEKSNPTTTKRRLFELSQQKYSKSPQTKENMNIKVGNEQDLFENQVINSK